MSIATTESTRTAIQTSTPSRRTASRASITRLEGRRTHETPSTPAPQLADPMALYDSLCDTCHGFPSDAPSSATMTCPSCGVASEEYALSVKMDAVLDDLAGMERLLDAVFDVA